MWKDKEQKIGPTVAVRVYKDMVFANIPRAVLTHLGVDPTSQLVFKLRSNKTVSIKLLKVKSERLITFKPLKHRKQFPALSTFLAQSR